ncbi:hypothetical protein ACIQ1S_23890 [Streptomyces griseus]|uniref:hypothetical protein n=1 Tax=Streptomyces griseus TaxID=1911 RepID=UPI003812B8A2
MTDISQALALHDMASRIDRLRFQLRTLPPAPAIPDVGTVSSQINTLARITTAVSDRIDQCLADLPSPGSKSALLAYSCIIAPLGEAITELGRIQAEVTSIRFAAHPAHKKEKTERARQTNMANEVISGSCEAADEILEIVVSGLREEAAKSAPSSTGRSGAASQPAHAPDLGPRHTPDLPPPPPRLTPRAPNTR